MENINGLNACALCPTLLDKENNSYEHIVPNSIGGRRKISSFICKVCNSKLGETWDAELWKQFSHVAFMHGICRERGDLGLLPIQTTDGKHYLLKPDGSMTSKDPTYTVTKTESAENINFSARSMKEAKKIAKGIQRKHPRVAVEDVLAKLQIQESNLDAPVIFSTQFGGDLAGRSMVKTAMALAFEAEVQATSCDLGLAYLKYESKNPPYAPFYSRDLIKNRPTDFAINCVAVLGCQKRKFLIGYVEYFSMWRTVVILSQNFFGESFESHYAFNPATGTELNPEIQLDLSDDEINSVFSGNAAPEDKFRAALESATGILFKRSWNRDLEKATSIAFAYAAEKLEIPWGGEILPEHAQRFSAYMVESMTPFLTRIAKR